MDEEWSGERKTEANVVDGEVKAKEDGMKTKRTSNLCS